MIIAKRIEVLQEAKEQSNGSIGFIPMMGALYQGHLLLIVCHSLKVACPHFLNLF